jgi:hypothetical protein
MLFFLVTSCLAQLKVKNSQNTIVMTVSEEGNVGIGATSPDKLRVAGRTWTDALRLGSSTTAGYVLTANQNGVGSWQQAPQFLKSIESVENDNGNIDLVPGNGINISANSTSKNITLALDPSIIEIFPLAQYVSPDYIIINDNGDYRISQVTTLQPGTYLSVFPGSLQISGGDPVHGVPPGNGGWIRLYEITSTNSYGKSYAGHHVSNLVNFKTSNPTVNIFEINQATDVAARLLFDAYDDAVSALVYWVKQGNPLIKLVKIK